MKEMVAYILIICYNLFLVCGTVYLVQVCDWSPWWFLFTVMLLGSLSYKKDDK